MNLINIGSDLDVLEMNKSDLIRISESLVNNFDESIKSPLKMLAFVSKMKTMLETIESGLTAKSMTELESYNGKHFAFGIEFQLSEAGVKYDYSANKKWVELNDQIKSLEEKRKAMEAFIKSLKQSITEVDEETGEAIKWFPPAKSSTTTIKKRIV